MRIGTGSFFFIIFGSWWTLCIGDGDRNTTANLRKLIPMLESPVMLGLRDGMTPNFERADELPVL